MQLRISILFLAIMLLPGCVLLTDPATRLAYDIQDSALELEASDLSELTIKHKPFGVDDDYRVFIQTTNPDAPINGSLSVGESSTSYHKRFVRVPENLQVWKKKGETVFIRLVKTDKEWKFEGGGETLNGNKAIELVELK